MDVNEIRRQEAERNHLLSVNAYREVPIMGTPAKGSIAADLKAAQEEIHRLLLQVSELQKELAELQHTGQHMTCGRCEQLRETQKRVVSSKKCAVCGYTAHSGRCGEQGGSGPEDGYA